MATPAKTPAPPPFGRLYHPDPATNRVVQDIYDKLQALIQVVPRDPPADQPAPSAPASALTRSIKSTTLLGPDRTLSMNVQGLSQVLLPPSKTVAGLGPYTIHNETGSAASVNLNSASGELVGGASAQSHVLAPGQSLQIQPGPGYWIAVGGGLAPGTSGIGSAPVTGSSPGVPAVPLTPAGNPAPVATVNPPTVTTLPPASDPLSVVGNYITFNGQQYIFTAPLTGAGAGYWQAVATAIATVRDTFANLSLYPAANYPVGTVFTATDWLVSYAVQVPTPTLVKTWIYYNGIYKAPIASIPGALGVNDKNFLFNASDYFHNWIWNGTAWHFTTGGFPAGLIEIFQSALYLPAGAKWHACDGSTQSVSQDNGTLASEVLPNVAGEYIVQ